MAEEHSKPLMKAVRLPKVEFYETHLSIINCLLPEKLTPMEIKVLANFMSLDGDAAIHKFGSSGRKIVMDELGISPSGMSNYIKSFVIKKFIFKAGDVYKIWNILEPKNKEQNYMIKLIMTDEEKKKVKMQITE